MVSQQEDAFQAKLFVEQLVILSAKAEASNFFRLVFSALSVGYDFFKTIVAGIGKCFYFCNPLRKQSGIVLREVRGKKESLEGGFGRLIVFQQQGKGAGNYFQIKFGREEKAVTFALRNRRKADVLRQVR